METPYKQNHFIIRHTDQSKCYWIKPLAHLYLPFLTEWNGKPSAERSRTKGKFAFHSVRLEVTVDRFPQKGSFIRSLSNGTERIVNVTFRRRKEVKLLTIRFVPFRRKRQV
uniref:Ribosomal protein L19 n=1 Tax=Romanomermis culicivorax TaxID=13658 RepID=A0A915IPR3_ROMCU